MRRQRDGLRQKQFSAVRSRSAGHSPAALDAACGAAPDCVFKRFPAIGDTPVVQKQHG
jgi:hypothetical protein